MKMETCQRCHGAVFYGSGAVGWGGPRCSCAQPVTQTEQRYPQQGGLSSYTQQSELSDILALLREIAEKVLGGE